MNRSRSEYRLQELGTRTFPFAVHGRAPTDDERSALAALLLDGYRGTTDDEGEGHGEALEAIDHYLGIIARDHSVVLDQGGELAALCFVVVVGGVHYIDPIVVAPAAKRRGLATRLTSGVLESLAGAGVAEVGAVITDGNVPSERLFTSLGFDRIGPWGQG